MIGTFGGELGRSVGSKNDDGPEITAVVPITRFRLELLTGFLIQRRCIYICYHDRLPLAVGQVSSARRSHFVEYLSQHWIAEAHHCFQFKDLLDAGEHRCTGLVFVAGAFDVGKE